jgi:hypothetical protein
MNAKDKARLKRYADEYHGLKTEIQKLDFMLMGSLQSRRRECGNALCRCHKDRALRHGPYWQWTRKVNAKTASVTLSDAQALAVEKWIQNGREFDRIAREMRRVSAKAVALVTGLDHARIAYSREENACP